MQITDGDVLETIKVNKENANVYFIKNYIKGVMLVICGTMQLVNLSNAEKYYTYTLTYAPATTLMPVFITLNLHSGQEKSTVDSCHSTPNILTDIT